jgi:hypothetical protein
MAASSCIAVISLMLPPPCWLSLTCITSRTCMAFPSMHDCHAPHTCRLSNPCMDVPSMHGRLDHAWLSHPCMVVYLYMAFPSMHDCHAHTCKLSIPCITVPSMQRCPFLALWLLLLCIAIASGFVLSRANLKCTTWREGPIQKRFIYRLLARHDFLPVWLVADK